MKLSSFDEIQEDCLNSRKDLGNSLESSNASFALSITAAALIFFRNPCNRFYCSLSENDTVLTLEVIYQHRTL